MRMSKQGKKGLVSKLRFPEFRDKGEWEPRLIEDFFFVGSSKRVLQEDWTTQGVPFYRTRELVSLSKNEPFGSEIFISEELFHEISERYGLPTEGDFLVSGVGTLGISYQVRSQDRFYFKDGNVLWLKQKGGIVSTFFKYCFEAGEIQKQILSQASISTVGTYTIQNAKVTKFSCPPNINEQQKIADCLSSIDELITAQAQKVDALKTHKKGLMQQLFPAEGETVPKRRFPEFRDKEEWDVKRIEDACEKPFSGGTPTSTNKKYYGGTIPFIRSAEIDKYKTELFLTEEGLKNSSAKLVKKDDVLVALYGANSGDVALGRIDGAINQAILCLRSKASNAFLYQYLSYKKQEIISTYLQGGQGNLSGDIIKSIELQFPDPNEQQKIADCLTSIDELITAQTQKIAALKTHKKGLMQQLFPAMDEVDA